MDQRIEEILQKIRDGLKKVKLRDLLLAVLGVIMVLFLITSVSASKKKITDLSQKAAAEVGEELTALLGRSEDLFNLKYEEAYLNARYSAARSGQFTLEVSVPDTLLMLSLDGIPLFRPMPGKIRQDRWIESLPPAALMGLAGGPAIIVKQWSTIEKEPIIVKHAPKDTLEVAPQTVPDTIIRKPVMMLLNLDNGVSLAILQSDQRRLGYNLHRSSLMIRHKVRQFTATIRGSFNREKRDYYPLVLIEIPARSAETLYRALPDSTLVVIKYFEDQEMP